MTNPYISRGPVREAKMFFGQVHELDEIAAFLKGNQSVSIVGPRKIGKTSLLYHLMRPEVRQRLGLGEDYIFIYLDCEVLGEGSHDEIFGHFVEELAQALDAQHLPPEPAIIEAQARPNRMAFERVVRKLNQRNLHVVLIMDEFERLSSNSQLDVNFFNALRSAAGRYQLAFITASARPLIQLTYSERSQEILSSPFFNIFAPLFLDLLDEDEAHALIREPSRAAGITFSPDTEEFIYTFVGGAPLALQVACFYAFDAFAGQTSEVPEFSEIHKSIEQRTMQEMSAHFEYYWRNLTPAEQNTLRQITELAARAVSDTTLRGILRDLVQKCLLIATGSGDYRYPSRAFAAFIAAQEKIPVSPSQIGILRGSPTLTGTHFGPYEVLGLLGKGGMSEVYKGRHTRLDRTVAIKILPASLAAEADFRTRFEREARAVAGLRHPNIVQIFDFGDLEGVYYMVMEYIAGQDLGQYMQDASRLSLEQALPLTQDLANALDYAHAQDLVHRDVKPSNVLLQKAADSGRKEEPSVPPSSTFLHPCHAILTDFGIAKMVGGDTGATKTGLMIGTLNYMAPEQIRSAGDVDGRADIYALGVMLFQMLTGQLPFQADNPGAMMLAHLQTPSPDPRTVVPDLSESVALAILRALAKDPAERFGTAGEMVEAMRS